MILSSAGIISLLHVCVKLTDSCEEVPKHGKDKKIAKNGEGCTAPVNVARLDNCHSLKREHMHLTLLDEALRGLDALKHKTTETLSQL